MALGAYCESIEVPRDATLRRTTKALIKAFEMKNIDEVGWLFYVPEMTLYVDQYEDSMHDEDSESYFNLIEVRSNRLLRTLYAIQPDESTISLVVKPPGTYIVAEI